MGLVWNLTNRLAERVRRTLSNWSAVRFIVFDWIILEQKKCYCHLLWIFTLVQKKKMFKLIFVLVLSISCCSCSKFRKHFTLYTEYFLACLASTWSKIQLMFKILNCILLIRSGINSFSFDIDQFRCFFLWRLVIFDPNMWLARVHWNLAKIFDSNSFPIQLRIISQTEYKQIFSFFIHFGDYHLLWYLSQ